MPTDRSERQSLEMLVLRQILADAIGFAHRPARWIADRQGADLCRGRQIALLQRRRHAQHVGDVVEPVSGVVGRQQRRCVDLQREQIANGVGVLGAVHAPQHRPAGVGIADAARSSSAVSEAISVW